MLVADAGYWHNKQMDRVTASGLALLVPPEAATRKTIRKGWEGGRYTWMRSVLASDHGHAAYRKH